MSATFDCFGFMPSELRKHFAELEDFVGEMDGKMLCTETDDNTVIDEGTVDGEEAVKAVNAIAAEIEQLRASLIDTQSLLAAILLEKRPDEEIEAQIIANRAILGAYV